MVHKDSALQTSFVSLSFPECYSNPIPTLSLLLLVIYYGPSSKAVLFCLTDMPHLLHLRLY